MRLTVTRGEAAAAFVEHLAHVGVSLDELLADGDVRSAVVLLV